MKIQIRSGVFETNSSSSHSMSFRNVEDEVVEFDGDEIILTGGEYGWGYEILTDWQDKLNYLAVDALDNEHRQSILQEAVDTYFGRHVKLTYDFSTDWLASSNGGKFAYIDHQSMGEIWGDLPTVSYVLDFIFSNKYTIIIDNDNH